MKVKIFFMLFLLLSIPAYADYFTGNDLVKLMNSKRTIDLSMYRGYVAGVQDSYNGTYFLVPSPVKMSQAEAIVSKYLRGHPEIWHDAAKNIVIFALQETFPLQEEKR